MPLKQTKATTTGALAQVAVDQVLTIQIDQTIQEQVILVATTIEMADVIVTTTAQVILAIHLIQVILAIQATIAEITTMTASVMHGIEVLDTLVGTTTQDTLAEIGIAMASVMVGIEPLDTTTPLTQETLVEILTATVVATDGIQLPVTQVASAEIGTMMVSATVGIGIDFQFFEFGKVA